METTARPRLDHYLRYRHGYEAAFLLAYMALNSIVSSTLVMIQVRRQSLPLEDWQVYAAAWTSDVVAFPLLVLVILFNVRGRAYPLRSTMAAIEARLDPQKFARVHRSHIVNLDHLVEIEPLDTGDARLKLRDGTTIPCSRTYRQALRGKQGTGDAGQSPGR